MGGNVKNFFDQADSNNDNVYNQNGSHKKLGKDVTSDQTFKAVVTATKAEIEAGKSIIDAITGVKITVVGLLIKVAGNFNTVTSIDLASSVTSVAIASLAQAQAVDGAVLREGATGVTLGAGFGVALPASEGVKVSKNGSAGTTGTSVTYFVEYKLSL